MKTTAGLIVAGVLLFGASLNDPFHFDDELIATDSNVTNPSRWAHFFNPFHLRQFTYFTFYLNHLVGGMNPAGFHAVNILIHIANAVMLLWLLRRYVDPWIAAMAAALFLVHPVQTEPVLYVYQRSTLLACFFSLLALLALAKGSTGWAVLSFFFAFESKESALAVPLAVAMFGGIRYERPPAASFYASPYRARATRGGSPPHEGETTTPARSTMLILPLVRGRAAAGGRESLSDTPAYWRLAVIAAVFLFATSALLLLLYVDERTVGIGAAKATSPLRYLLTQTRVVFTYLRLLVFPYPQSLEYEFQNAGGILSVIGVLAILSFGWLARHSIWGLLILVFFVMLAPTSSIIPSADAAFEHRLYLPMLACSLFLALLISKIPRRTWIATAVLVLLTILTARREVVWSSDVALWEDAVHHAPGKPRAWFNLGGAYLSSDPDKARAALLRALQLQPHFPQALYDLGLIEQRRKRWDAALSYYQQVLAQDPGYWPATNNIGNTLFAKGERQRSVEYFLETLRLNPDYWPAQYNIAIVHYESSRYMDAARRLETVLDWRPEFREARYLLAASLDRAGHRSSADEQWRRLGETSPTGSRHTPTMILSPSRP